MVPPVFAAEKRPYFAVTVAPACLRQMMPLRRQPPVLAPDWSSGLAVENDYTENQTAVKTKTRLVLLAGKPDLLFHLQCG